MLLETTFRHIQASPALHDYAFNKLLNCERIWQRQLDLRLIFMQNRLGIHVELVGRDAEGRSIACFGQGHNAYKAIDDLCLKFRPLGLLLARSKLVHPSPQKAPSVLENHSYRLIHHQDKAQNTSRTKDPILDSSAGRLGSSHSLRLSLSGDFSCPATLL